MYGIVNAGQYVENYNPRTGAVTWTDDRERAQAFSLAEAAEYQDFLGVPFRLDSHQLTA